MSSEENYLKVEDIPSEVWVTLGVLGGILVSYCLCMRQGYSDNWIGKVPPGPTHLPFFGCLLQLLQACSLSGLMSRLVLAHGSVVKFCVCRTKVTVTCGCDLPHNQDLLSLTAEVLVFILRALGLPLPASRSFMEECNRLMYIMYNYQLPLQAIREMMEDLEKSGLTRKKKKLEYLVFQLTKQKVVLDKEEVESLEECSRDLEIFSSSLEGNPTMFLPVFHYFPWYILQRKRIYKNVSKVQQKLCEILNGKVKNYTDDAGENIYQLFFIIFIFINISRTVLKKQKSRCVQKKSIICEQQVSTDSDVVTPLTKGLTTQMREFTSSTSAGSEGAAVFLQRKKISVTENPEEILVLSEEKRVPSYDICGLRFYLATKSTKISDFDLPEGCLVVYYSTE